MRLSLLPVLLFCAVAAGADDDPSAASRALFVAAWEDTADTSRDEALRDYPLYPYLQAERIRRALGQDADAAPVDAAAARFLAAQAGQPVARVLRGPWLADLARRGQWSTFLEHYPASSNDPELRCQALRARLALGRQDGLVADAQDAWLTGRSAPDACDPVFAWLREQRKLTPELIERRARLALAAGEARLARWLARSLPEPTAAAVRDWATLIERPQEAIDAAITAPSVVIEPAALLDGYTRLARRDPQAARARFARLVAARDLDAAQASKLARALALGLAWSRQPEALEYFERVAPEDRDDLVHEWWARAALWRADWARVQAVIAAMPPALRDTNPWRYWEARAVETRDGRKAARPLYERVLPTDNWYAVLSAARLGKAFAPTLEPIPVTPAQVAALATRPEFVRARELFLAGRYELAPAEFRAGLAAGVDAERPAAALLASAWGWHFQAIATAAQERLFNDYPVLYPRPYDREVAQAAKATGLAPTLIYSIIRQESLYQPYAVSSANAIGLMQLLPGTARRTAVAIGESRPSAEDLKRPAINVQLGAATLADLVQRFDGQLVLALAGYNAGPGAVARWLPDKPREVDVWVENIPFNETRGYVQRVMWHSVVFEWLSDGGPEDAGAWLVQVRDVK